MTQESVYCIKVSHFLKCKNSEGQRRGEAAEDRGKEQRQVRMERRKGVKEGVKHSETDMTKEGSEKGQESGEYEVFQGFM